MSKELYSEGLKHLSSILLKAQGRLDAETQSDIDIGYECMRLRVVLDGMNAHPKRQQDVEEFIAETCEEIDETGFAYVPVDDLRAWMAGHVRVPAEFIEVLDSAPYINPSNYDHDQVCELNSAVREALAMLNASKADPEPDLWCVHILGPDDLHAAPSRAYAEVAADLHGRRFADLSAKLDVVCKAVVAPWPYSRESHAEDVASFIDDWFMLEQPIASPASASKGE